MPAPAAAFLVLVPVAVDLEFGIAWAREAAYVCGWLVAIGALAVSAVPTFAGKGLKLPVGAVLPVMAGGSILIAGVFMQPWITYMVLALAYVSTISVVDHAFLSAALRGLIAHRFPASRAAHDALTVETDICR